LGASRLNTYERLKPLRSRFKVLALPAASDFEPLKSLLKIESFAFYRDVIIIYFTSFATKVLLSALLDLSLFDVSALSIFSCSVDFCSSYSFTSKSDDL